MMQYQRYTNLASPYKALRRCVKRSGKYRHIGVPFWCTNMAAGNQQKLESMTWIPNTNHYVQSHF